MSTCSNVRFLADPVCTQLTCIENHINGENLMEMDQTQLKEMGIKKVGDRVRIGSQAKQLRNKEYKRVSRRVSNRVSDPLRDSRPGY
jgi:mitogen-activated protein kinase kinase kinase